MLNISGKYSSHIILFFILSLYLFFGLQHLGKFITADEHYWVYERIPQYWSSISEGNWKKTSINDKPGVTLALVSGMGLLYDPHPETICTETVTAVTDCDTVRAEKTLFAFRLPILLINALLLIYIWYCLSKLYDKRTALYAISFIALSPILIGMTQIVNPDSLLWSFGTAALLSFMILLKQRERKFIFFSGILLGFAILSKYTASFLLPFFIFLIIADIFLRKSNFPETLKKNILENIFFSLSVFLIGIAVMLIALPAIWFRPSILGNLLAGGEAYFSIAPFLTLLLLFTVAFFSKTKIISAVLNFTKKIRVFLTLEKIVSILFLVIFVSLIVGRIAFPEWEIFAKIPFDLKDLYSSDKPDKTYFPNTVASIFLELNPLIFSVVPIVLVLLIGRFLLTIFLPSDEYTKNGKFENFSFLFYFFFFLIAILLSEILATPRYLILLYPILSILAATTLTENIQFLKNHHLFIGKYLAPAIILLLAISVFSSQPFYFNYTNSLLPKEKIIHSAWGYGGYEAAQYLNSLPNAQNLLVWSDYYGVCEFFKGRCVAIEYKAAAGQPFDYAILSHRGRNLYRPEHITWTKKKNLQMSAAYADQNPAWSLLIDERPENFIKVVKVTP